MHIAQMKEEMTRQLEWRNVEERGYWKRRVSGRRGFAIKQPAYANTL